MKFIVEGKPQGKGACEDILQWSVRKNAKHDAAEHGRL